MIIKNHFMARYAILLVTITCAVLGANYALAEPSRTESGLVVDTRSLVILASAFMSVLISALLAPLYFGWLRDKKAAKSLEKFIRVDIELGLKDLQGRIAAVEHKLTETDKEIWDEPHITLENPSSRTVQLQSDKKYLNHSALREILTYYAYREGAAEIISDLRTEEFKILTRDRKIIVYNGLVGYWKEQLKHGQNYLDTKK